MAARITPVSWKRLRCVFELDGYVFTKGKGSHWVGRKPGIGRPVVIPEYDEIALDVIRSNMRSAGMSRERYLALLARC
jgi:predicted RNA binding protein YcfA (HicA-like mRNA interferase family)